MKRILACLIPLFFFLSSFAQSRLHNAANVGYSYNNKKLQFKIYAPNAKEVKLAGWDIMSYTGNTRSGEKSFNGLPLQKDSSGIWSIVLDSMEVQPYQYFFWVDGVRTLDPSNKVVLETYQQPFSVAEVKDRDTTAFWQMRNVQHGSVHYLTYYSSILRMHRPLVVYTPPGYQNSNEVYPVLYLLHGAGEISSSWVTAGKAHNIADNLISAKQAKPCIIVMPLGHPEGFAGRADSALLDKQHRFAWMEKELVQVIFPLIENQFRVKADKWNRSIAGLSMGGAQATYIGLRNIDKFSYIGIFSAGDKEIATTQAAFLKNPKKANKELKFLFVGVGELDHVGRIPNEAESGILYNTRVMIETFAGAGITYKFRLLPKTDHTWYAWRRFLYEDFLPALWK